MEFSMAIDAGGTFFKYGIVDSTGNILKGSLSMIPVNSNGSADEIFACYERCITEMHAHAAGYGATLTGLGVSTPGPFDYTHYTSRMEHKFASIKGIDIRQALIDRKSLEPACKVNFMHDGHAFLLGECWTGAASGFANVMGITIGTGLGVGFYLNGQLCDNGSGGPLTSIYSLPHDGGTVEDVVSGRGITKLYNSITKREKAPDCREVGIRAGNGDKYAIDTFVYAGKVLGQTIAPLIDKYHIECCVLGGQVSRSFIFLKKGLDKTLVSFGNILLTSGKNLNTSTLIGAASPVLK